MAVVLAAVVAGCSGGSSGGGQPSQDVGGLEQDADAQEVAAGNDTSAEVGAEVAGEVAGDTAVDTAKDVATDETADNDLPPPTPARLCDEDTPCPEGFWCVGAQASAPGVCLPSVCESDADCALDLPDAARGCCTRESVKDGLLTTWPKLGKCRITWQPTCPANSTWATAACGADEPVCDDEVSQCVRFGLSAPSCEPECASTSICPPGLWCHYTKSCIAPQAGDAPFADCSARGDIDCQLGQSCNTLGRLGADGRQIAICTRSCGPQTPCPTGSACVMGQTFLGTCFPTEGTVPAGGSCAHDTLSCATGLVCLRPGTEIATCSRPGSACAQGEVPTASVGSAPPAPLPDPLHWEFFQPGCAPDHPPSAIGAPCQVDPMGTCGTGWCWPGGCTKQCVVDADCPGGHCPYEGVAGVRRFCAVGSAAEGAACSGDLDCAAGLSCVDEGSQPICRRNCGVRGPLACPEGAWCDGATCQPVGSGDSGAPCPNGASDCAEGLLCHPVGAAGAPACRRRCRSDVTCALPGDVCHLVSEHRGFCAPPGPTPAGADCTADPASCAAGLVCFGSPAGKQCVHPCGVKTSCPAGTACTKELLGEHGLVCLPSGDLGRGADCATDPFGCADGLECVGPGLSSPGAWAQCQPRCGAPYGACASGLSCRHIQQGRAWCFDDGAASVGDSCDADPAVCPAKTLCVPGTSGARCLATCLPGSTCPEGSQCTPSPEARSPMCIPAGFVPSTSGTWAAR